MKRLMGVLMVVAAVSMGVAGEGLATSPWLMATEMAYTNDCGADSVCMVVGSCPELGNWTPTNGVLLSWNEGNVWRASVGVPSGTTTEYKFISRRKAADVWFDENNVVWEDLEGNHQVVTAAEPESPQQGKRVVLLCGYDSAKGVNLIYSMLDSEDFESTNDWHTVAMTETSPGRWEVDGVGEEGRWMRFCFQGYFNGEVDWHHEYGTDGDFHTPLDAFCVRGGEVFNYEPSGELSTSQIVSWHVDSFNPDSIPGRDIRIYLPRGYAEQTNRSYPVVYMSDGQRLFVGDTSQSGGAWEADRIADQEIRGGRMREAIIVAVPCRTDTIEGFDARQIEYLPDTDVDPIAAYFQQQIRGRSGDYAKFLKDNVKPTLDWNFRTRGDYANTAVIGSSSGGLLSMYLGTHTENVFGLVGAMSGVYNEEFCPNYVKDLEEHPRKAGRKLWIDIGTQETAVGNDLATLNLYESNYDQCMRMLRGGHVTGRDLRFLVVDDDHTEWAWQRRLHRVFQYLLDVREEANPLLEGVVISASVDGDGLSMTVPMYGWTDYVLQKTSNLTQGGWSEALWLGQTDHPWGSTNVWVGFDRETSTFYRVRGE